MYHTSIYGYSRLWISSEEYTSHFTVNANVTNLKNLVVGNMVYAINLGFQLLRDEFPVFNFFQNEKEALQWVEKMRDFSYVKVLKTLKKQDFVILNGLLQSKTIIDIGKEINRSESTVRKRRDKLFKKLGVREIGAIQMIFRYSEQTGEVKIEDFNSYTRKDLEQIFEEKVKPQYDQLDEEDE